MQQSCHADNRLITFGPIEQGTFIRRMGGDVRLEVLIDNATEEQKKSLKSGYDMLISNEKMGKRFKFFSIFPSVLKDHLAMYPVTGFS